MGGERTIAVALHDVEPATFERCALIRDWLHDHGVDRVTLLVVPAVDLHPLFQRRPDLAAWLLDCRDRGDTVAQHGFHGGREFSPGYAYTPAPRRELAGHDAWWATVLRLVGHERDTVSPLCRCAGRLSGSGRARSRRAGCSGSTCTPPTSTARVACWRSSPSSAAPPAVAPSRTTSSPRRRLPPRGQG